MADPIWLEKLKRLFGQSISSERITPERPEFTGTPGYNTNIINPHTGKSSWKELWTDQQPFLRKNVRMGGIGGGFKNLPKLSKEGLVLEKGLMVDPHLAAAAGGPGWGSGMAPSTMTKVPASAAGGGFKRVLKHLGAMESPGPDWSLQAQKLGVPSPWSPTNTPYNPTYLGQSSAVAGIMGFDPNKKKRYA